jgi:hypothetical protein
MEFSHVIQEIHVCTKMHFWNYMLYFRKYMADNHVIPKLHNCKKSVKNVSRVTWLSAT